MKANRTHPKIKSNTSNPQAAHPLLTAFCAGALLLAAAHAAFAQSGIWTNTLSETWGNTVNWAGGTVADGTGNTADFNTVDLTGQTTVTLDSARTLGSLIFGDTDTNTPAGWIVSNGGVVANSLNVTSVTVNPIFTTTTATIFNSTNDAILSAVVTGSGFVKKGAGTLSLQTTNAMGSLRIDEGLISIGTATALGNLNKKVTFNGGGVIIPGAVGNIGNTNEVLTAGHIYPPTANYDSYNGPFVGSSSATLNIHATSGRFTINGGGVGTMSNFFGTLDLSDSAAGLIRFNLGAGPYNCSAITFNLGTNSGRLAPRITANPSTFSMGSLSGGPNTRLESSEQGTGLNTTWEIGALNTSTVMEGRLMNYTGTAGRHGHLRKIGTGRLTLMNSANAYTGNTTVSNGVLALSNACSIASSPVVNVAAGALLDVSGLASTFGLAAAQTLGGNGGVIGNVAVLTGTIAPGIAGVGTLSFTNNLSLDGTLTATNLFEVTSPGTGDVIQVAGDLSFANTVVVRVVPTGASIPNGTYTLFKWSGNLTGDTNNLALDYPPQTGTLVLETNLVAKEIRLVVSGVSSAANLVWKGDGVANDWDSVTVNWLNGVTPSLFVNGDKATFDNTGSNNLPVNLAANVNPGSLVFNATKDYTIASSGAFGIVGSSTLVKSNTGALTVTADNSFTGGTLIAGGAIQIGDGAASSGSLSTGNITNNAKLIYNRPDNITTANLIVGSGAVVQAASSVLTIAGNNSYSGGTIVSNGTVNLASYNTLGSGPINMAGGTLIIVPSGGATTGVSNNINVTQDSILQYNAANSFAAVILAPITGVNGKTLTINHTPNGGQDRLRLYASFTNDANLVLNDAAVWMAPYVAGGAQLYNGVISGAGSFVNRAGGSTITFNTNNTFTGDARITTGAYGVGVDSVSSGGSLVSSPLGLGSLVMTNESDGVDGNGGITAVNGARIIENAVNYSRSNAFTLIVSGTNDLTLAGPISLHGQVDGLGGVDRAFQVESTARTILAGTISDNSLTCGVTKTGNGTLTLNGTNTAGGLTLVSAGVLDGNGLVSGNVTVGAGGALGAGSGGIGELRIGGNLSLGGGLFIEVNKSVAPSNDTITVTGTLNNTGTGTATVTNLGPALAVGDSFKLFSSSLPNGGLLNIAPAPGAGLGWTNKLAIDGTIAVVTAAPVVNPNPTNITAAFTGTDVTLSWPASHIGWNLQVQTNSRAVGLTLPTNTWFTVPGSSATNLVTMPVNKQDPTVFYRLQITQ